MKSRHYLYKDYEADSDGFVTSYKRQTPTKLQPIFTGKTYQIGVNNRHYLLHKFIWECFNGEIPKDNVIYFINGDNTDRRLENLGMRTKSEHQRAVMTKWWTGIQR
jgi:hypothetical protein